jgi:hypothetical protein
LTTLLSTDRVVTGEATAVGVGRIERSSLHRLRVDEDADVGITRGEIREALGAPRSSHFFSTEHSRMNVRHRLSVSGRTIVVSYEERGEQTVVNAAREKG